MQRGKQEARIRAINREYVSLSWTMGLLKSHLIRTSSTVANAIRSKRARPMSAIPRVIMELIFSVWLKNVICPS
jgi:hypothetical protein